MYSDKSVKNNFWDLGNDSNGLQTATGSNEISGESDLNFNDENIIKKKWHQIEIWLSRFH